MLPSPYSSSSIELMNNDVQPNTNDCSAYARAFAVFLAFGKEPIHCTTIAQIKLVKVLQELAESKPNACVNVCMY